MPSFELGKTTYETDEDGYLVNSSNWNREIAKCIAASESVIMTNEHWMVVNFLRAYYEKYKIAPMIRILTKAMGEQLGKEKGNTTYLYILYPGGPAKQACKIAGMPESSACNMRL